MEPSLLRSYVDRPDVTVALDQRGRVNYQAVSQDGMDEDEEFPASENLAPAFVISGTDHGNKRTGEQSWPRLLGHSCGYFFFYQLRAPVTTRKGEGSSQEGCPGVGVNAMAMTAPFNRAPVAKRPRRRTLLVGAKEAAEKFGPLKVVLEAIPASYANRKVRLELPAEDPIDKRIPRELSPRERQKAFSHV